ncbi:MAG: group II intron maturase-specific domain-containing protein [Blastocatellia bacterium]
MKTDLNQSNKHWDIILIITQLNKILRGWYEYFQDSHRTTWPRLDKWLRMRIRSWRDSQNCPALS